MAFGKDLKVIKEARATQEEEMMELNNQDLIQKADKDLVSQDKEVVVMLDKEISKFYYSYFFIFIFKIFLI